MTTSLDTAVAVLSTTTPEDAAAFLIAGKSPVLSRLLSAESLSDADVAALTLGVETLGKRQGQAVAGIAVGVHVLSEQTDMTGVQLAALAQLSQGRISQLRLAGKVLAEVGCASSISPAALCTAVSNGTKGKLIRAALAEGGNVASIRKSIADIVRNDPPKAPKAVEGTTTTTPNEGQDEVTSGMPSASGTAVLPDPEVSLRESVRRFREAGPMIVEHFAVLTEDQQTAVVALARAILDADEHKDDDAADAPVAPVAPKPGPASKRGK